MARGLDRKPSEEFFYRDDEGNKRDAEFHEELLNDTTASDNADIVAARQAVADGDMTEDEAINAFFTSSQRKRILRQK